jgi:hypothetical protein
VVSESKSNRERETLIFVEEKVRDIIAVDWTKNKIK